MKNRLLVCFLVILLLVAVYGCTKEKSQIPATGKIVAEKDAVPSEKFKVLHIMSYHTPWVWTEDQLSAFKTALNGLDVEYKVFEMDTKRKSSDEWKEAAGKEARDLIDSWQPDLVYTNDDNAQEYVAKYYINSSIPFVFSGVNANPEDYGFAGSTNNAGILEREHSVETINLLREIVPTVKKIAVISDTDITWPPIIQRMKQRIAKEIPDVEIVAWDILDTFEEFKQKMKEYETKADAVIHLGDFNYKYENNTNVPFEKVEEWCIKNSKLPDASFWEDRVINGYLVSVTISGYEQGKGAGIMARQILEEGKSPSSLGFLPTYKGKPVINMARAKGLGINIKSDLLLTAKVIDKFEWEK